jgi:lactoylglutathione lyase
MENATFNQTMLRIKDPKLSIPFYEKWFGMTLVNKKDYSDFSLYFLVTLPEGHTAPTPGTPEAEIYLKGGSYGCCLELTHNHGTEDQEDFKYHHGNVEPRGFGHIGFIVDDVYKLCEEMISAGVPFPVKPNDGGIKELGFAADPDGYWVEVIKRSETAAFKGRPVFQQTMIRVNELEKSVAYYRDMCKMTMIDRLEFPEWKFTLAFMATIPEAEKAALPTPGTEEAHTFLWGFTGTTLELTYNHGTETDPAFTGYNNGNVEPNRGFGHVAMMVDDVYAASAELEAAGVKFQKKPDEGRMKGLAFALDPDGYWVEIVKRMNEEQTRAYLAAKEADAAAKAKEAADSAADAGADDEKEGPDRRLTMAMAKPAASEETLKTGYLSKVGGGFRSWKKRFFVLTTSAIAYYTDQTRHQADLKGGVLLEQVQAVEISASYDTKKPHCLTVATKDRRYVFQAADDAERAGWIKAILDAKAKSGKPGKPAGTGSEPLSEIQQLQQELADIKARVGLGTTVIISAKVTDEAGFKQAVEASAAVVSASAGGSTAATVLPGGGELIEGSALPTATIVQMWGSKEAFVAFYNGAAFKDAKELLLKSADLSIVLA